MSAPTRQRASIKRRRPRISEQDADSFTLRLRPVQIAKAMAAFVTFAATVSGLVFGLWPALKPAEPPATKGATLTNVTIDRVSFGHYLDRIAQSRSPYLPTQLQRPGVLVSFDFNIKGYLTKKLPLQWQLIDAQTGEQVDQSRDLLIIPTAAEDQNNWSVWVPISRDAGRRFFVEIQLLDDLGFPLDRIRTNRFSGT